MIYNQPPAIDSLIKVTSIDSESLFDLKAEMHLLCFKGHLSDWLYLRWHLLGMAMFLRALTRNGYVSEGTY